MKYGTTNEKATRFFKPNPACLLYTSDAADERSSVDLGGRRIIKKKKKKQKQRGRIGQHNTRDTNKYVEKLIRQAGSREKTQKNRKKEKIEKK